MVVQTCPLIQVFCLLHKSDKFDCAWCHSSCRLCCLSLHGWRWHWEMFSTPLKWISKRVLLGHLEMSVPISQPASQPASTPQIRLSSMTTDLPWTEMGWNTLANKYLAAHKYCVPVYKCVCSFSVCCWFKTWVKISIQSMSLTLLSVSTYRRLWI